MPGIKYRISLEGGEQVQKELLTVEQAVKQLQNSLKTSAGADTFASTTAAISALGKTSDEAFSAAAAAAKKFGASSNELARVDGIIKALATRSRDSGTAFATLAQNYDKARASIGGTGRAIAGEAAALGNFAASTAKVGRASQEASAAIRVLGGEVRTIASALATAGVPIGGVASNLASLASTARGVGPVFGTIAVAVAAISAASIGGTAALFKFAEGAEKTVTALDEMAKAGGNSFQFLSEMQVAFAQGGTSLEQFAQAVNNLQQQISSAIPKMAGDLASSTQTSADAQVNYLKKLTESYRTTGEQARSYGSQIKQVLKDQQDAQLAVAKQQMLQAQANQLDTVIQKFRQLSQGIKTTFDPLTTLETKTKAIIDLLATPRLGAFGVPIKEQAGVASAALMKLADIFSNIQDEAQRVELAKALKIPPEMLAQLEQGSAFIERMTREVFQLGLALNQTDQQSVKGFKTGLADLSGTFTALKNKMGALAAPAFTSFFQGLSERIKQLVPDFSRLASAFGQLDFRALGRGVGDFLLTLGKAALAVGQFFAALGRGDTKGIEKALDDLGTLIKKKVFGLGQEAGKGFAQSFGESAAQLGATAGAAFAEAVLNSIKTGLTPKTSLWDAIVMDFATFGESLVKNAGTLGDKIKRGLSGLFVTPAGAAEAGGGQQLGGADFGPMIAAAEVAAVRIKGIFADALNQSITIDFSAVTSAAQTAATEVGSAFSNIDISSALSAQIDALITKFGQLASAATAAASAAASAASSGSGNGGTAPAPFARGGLFGGRGTGTSDSNLAWVSRGEHIMPARAVRQPGVLAFLEALRRSGGDLSRLLDGMGRFALGGMIPRAIPAFANGGPVGGMNNVTIQFPGVPPVGGLRASSEVVDQLHKAAALAQVRSGGRKPSRYS